MDRGGVETAENGEESADGIVGGEVSAVTKRKASIYRDPTDPRATPEWRLRPVEFWIPDVKSASFRAEARRQCKAVANNPLAGSDQDFVDLISDFVSSRKVRSRFSRPKD